MLEFSWEGRSLEEYLQRGRRNFAGEEFLECLTQGRAGSLDPVAKNPDPLSGALNLDSRYLNGVL